MRSTLAGLSWHKVSLRLKNIRNIYAREHPLAIFEAVFKRAATLPGREVDLDFVFHPVGYILPVRINKNREYPLELVFFQAEEAGINRFLDNLKIHLRDRHNNFELLALALPERRTLQDLEQDELPDGCDEICLDFLTPFPFTPKFQEKNVKSRHTIIDRDVFFSILTNRVARAFNLKKDAFADQHWEDFRLLPYYWQYQQFGHRPKSNAGRSEYINGAVGPLYIKGPISRIYSLLLLCSEINAGNPPAKGRGAFTLQVDQPFFDLRLQRLDPLQRAYVALEQESDIAEDLQCIISSPEELLRELHDRITKGDYRPAAFQGFTIPKKSGGRRLIAVADPRDHLVQKMLHTLLTPVFERMFEQCSIGFRRGRSRQQARSMVTAAVRQGFTHVLESDVESFFDSVDWPLMLERLANLLPRADRLTFSLLERFIKADLTVNNRPCPRDRGLIQGMVLAPLLANLFLDTFDEKMNALGYRMVRYGDDFLVLTRSLEEGKKARQDAAKILDRLGLELKGEKTAVTALDAGFSFLGFDFGPELDEEFIDRTALRKTVFIRSMYAFAGIDSGSLIIRKGGRLITRLPMNRIGEIVIFGNNTVSARLLHQCSRENIPVSFCRAAGRYINTLRPDSKAFFAIAARHARRFETTPAEQRRDIAGRIAAAKLAGYSSWFAGRYGSRTKRVCALLRARINSIMEAETVETIRGLEGEATGRIYEFLRPLFVDTAFRSARRLPRAKCDPWNVLTDFTSFLFFSKLNVLLRSQGLNPYLGFLHSHKDNYESLVCDLQEPFRARMDRFVLKTVNRRVVRPEHFEFSSQYKTFQMKSEGIGPFLEAFEREMNVRLAGDGGTLKQLLVAQVQVVRRWVDGKGKLFFYQPQGQSPSSARAG